MKIPTAILKPYSPNKLWKDKVFQVVQRDGAKCKHCGIEEADLLTVDHIKPKCVGGGDEIENLQILCKRCHHKKDKDIPTVIAINEKYIQKELKKYPQLKNSLWYQEVTKKRRENVNLQRIVHAKLYDERNDRDVDMGYPHPFSQA